VRMLTPAAGDAANTVRLAKATDDLVV